MSPKERKKMVSKRVDICLSRQYKILRISRSLLYYTPIGFNAETLELMRQIDKVLPNTRFSAVDRLRPICRGLGITRVAIACVG